MVILSDHGRIFVTGPDVVRSVTGEDVDLARLGGPEPHSRRSGVVHVVAADRRRGARPGPGSWPLLLGGQGAGPGRGRPDRGTDLGRCCPIGRAGPTTCTR